MHFNRRNNRTLWIHISVVSAWISTNILFSYNHFCFSISRSRSLRWHCRLTSILTFPIISSLDDHVDHQVSAQTAWRPRLGTRPLRPRRQAPTSWMCTLRNSQWPSLLICKIGEFHKKLTTKYNINYIITSLVKNIKFNSFVYLKKIW